MKKEHDSNRQSQPADRHSRARRRLLKSVAAGSAAVTVKGLPEKWAKPALDTALLPAHAASTCQTESLTCTVTSIEYASDGSFDEAGPARHSPSPPPLTGNDPTSTVDYLMQIRCPGPTATGDVDSATLSLTATVTPSCGPVELVSSISEFQDAYDIDSGGGTQSGVVDPDTGEVSFNNVIVGIQLPGPTENTDPLTESANLDLTFATPGVPDCVISITFTEDTGRSCGR